MSTWTIHYDDGTVLTGSGAKEWAAAPDEGVLIVVVGEGKTNVQARRDYYLLRGATVMSFDAVGLHGQLKQGVPKGSLKFGRWVEDETWRRVWNAAFPEQPL